MHGNVDLSLEIDRRIRIRRERLKRFGTRFFVRTTAPPSLNVRMLKAEVIETLLCVCVCSSH